MALTGSRTFVGFGFGAIQAGLFLYEAYRSGNFGRLVVAEVLPDVVQAMRQAGGHFAVNVAHADHIVRADVGPVEIERPGNAEDRERLIAALVQAEEIATAIPSVAYYASPGPDSLHRILAEGLRWKAARSGPQAVVYAAENDNRAAEILQAAVMAEIPAAERPAVERSVRFLNTVIGKMSGVVTEPSEIREQFLAPITPGSSRAILVEAFNRILISRIDLPPAADGAEYHRGIDVFEEKRDLLPFEEAKLYGHNAIHALAAYLGIVRGVKLIADLPQTPGVMPLLRAAFLHESGAALSRKYAGVDPLFTESGFRLYADDLLDRMTNPFLRDTVERVGRDPQRKLSWDDRLIGTIRLCAQQGIAPRRLAMGAAAALTILDAAALKDGAKAAALLTSLWRDVDIDAGEQAVVLDWVEQGRLLLKQWLEAEYSDSEPG